MKELEALNKMLGVVFAYGHSREKRKSHKSKKLVPRKRKIQGKRKK